MLPLHLYFFKMLINMIAVNNKKHSQMKKLSFVMCAIVIALCTVFVSCKEKVAEAPSIFFQYGGVLKNNGDEIDAKVGDEVTIIADYYAQGHLNLISLNVESNHRVYEDLFYGGVFTTNTNHKIKRTIKFEDVEDVQIKAFVVDKQKDPIRSDFEIKVKVR